MTCIQGFNRAFAGNDVSNNSPNFLRGFTSSMQLSERHLVKISQGSDSNESFADIPHRTHRAEVGR